MRRFTLAQELVRCRRIDGSRAVIGVGTVHNFPHLVSLEVGEVSCMLRAADAEKLAVILVKAGMRKEL
jgi:hypothetical protein